MTVPTEEDVGFEQPTFLPRCDDFSSTSMTPPGTSLYIRPKKSTSEGENICMINFGKIVKTVGLETQANIEKENKT